MSKKVTDPQKIKEKTKGANNQAFSLDDPEGNLNEQQRLFCMEYCQNGFNGTKAAIKANYAQSCAKEQASRLLSNANVVNYLDILKADLGLRIGVTAEMVAKEMAKIAFSNIKSIFNDGGSIKELSTLTDAEAACISQVEVVEIFGKVGSEREQIGVVKKIKFWDKQKALSDINVMLGYNKPTKIANTDTEGKDLPAPITITTLSQLLIKQGNQ